VSRQAGRNENDVVLVRNELISPENQSLSKPSFLRGGGATSGASTRALSQAGPSPKEPHMRTAQIDQLKRVLYADPTLTDGEREAAELALEAMRPQAPRSAVQGHRAAEGVDRPPTRSWPLPRRPSPILGSFRPFMRKRAVPIVPAGKERWAVHDRDAKRRIMAKIEAHTIATEPGRAWGDVTPKILMAARYLLDCVNTKDGRCFPSYKRIAEHVRRETGSCSIGTAMRAARALVKIGVLEWFNRCKTILEDVADFFGGAKRERVVRTSNGYRFIDPDPEPQEAVEKPANSSNADLRQGTLFPRKDSSFSFVFEPLTDQKAPMLWRSGPQPAT
jgi:hypothetical protein